MHYQQRNYPNKAKWPLKETMSRNLGHILRREEKIFTHQHCDYMKR